MLDIASLIQHGATNLWLFIPSAIALGALHGLEPGHSKTMMAAFIIAIRGTVKQAVLLGLSATVSHTVIVWIVALIGLYFGKQWGSETNEPYFMLISATLMIVIALWMIRRTWKHQSHPHEHHHEHDHACDHNHHDEDDHTTPMPHHCRHEHETAATHDPHAVAHALHIERHFKGRDVTTGQIILFGLTGGLIPCPASVTVLLLCLQLKQLTLGALLVACFSIGLAVTMVSAGVIAAFGARHVAKRWSGFSTLAERAPYLSGALIIAIALYLGYHGLRAIS